MIVEHRTYTSSKAYFIPSSLRSHDSLSLPHQSSCSDSKLCHQLRATEVACPLSFMEQCPIPSEREQSPDTDTSPVYASVSGIISISSKLQTC